MDWTAELMRVRAEWLERNGNLGDPQALRRALLAEVDRQRERVAAFGRMLDRVEANPAGADESGRAQALGRAREALGAFEEEAGDFVDVVVADYRQAREELDGMSRYPTVTRPPRDVR